MIICLVLAITQSVVLGVLLLTQFAGSLYTADPASFTSGVLLLGTPLAVLASGIYKLLNVQLQHREVVDLETDPWNEPGS